VPIRHETDLAVGVAGLRRDHDILEEASLDESIVTPVGMADWMSSFHADSIPDLNYCGPLEPRLRRGARGGLLRREMWACLEAMELGDVDEARHPVLGPGGLVGAAPGRRTGELSTQGQRFWPNLLQRGLRVGDECSCDLTFDSQTKRC